MNENQQTVAPKLPKWHKDDKAKTIGRRRWHVLQCGHWFCDRRQQLPEWIIFGFEKKPFFFAFLAGTTNFPA
jgi:hypothetical protein